MVEESLKSAGKRNDGRGQSGPRDADATPIVFTVGGRKQNGLLWQWEK